MNSLQEFLGGVWLCNKSVDGKFAFFAGVTTCHNVYRPFPFALEMKSGASQITPATTRFVFAV
jgi:hypothetical protein